MSHESAWRWLLLIAVIGFVGCGEASGVSVEYVEGVVTLDDKPIEGVTVGFSPVKPDSGTPAVGITDANGVFKLTATAGGTPGGGTGVGDYQVTFSKVVTSGQSEITKTGDPGYGKSMTTRPGPTKIEYVVPQKYGNAATSGFTATVVKGTNKGDKFKYDLKSQ